MISGLVVLGLVVSGLVVFAAVVLELMRIGLVVLGLVVLKATLSCPDDTPNGANLWESLDQGGATTMSVAVVLVALGVSGKLW